MGKSSTQGRQKYYLYPQTSHRDNLGSPLESARSRCGQTIVAQLNWCFLPSVGCAGPETVLTWTEQKSNSTEQQWLPLANQIGPLVLPLPGYLTMF